MRLTLRTLLSYRDGVLSAKAHEELGQKFRDSQTAQSLASRIDSALSNPQPLARELAQIEQTCSPNEVSEFLDGVMSLDRVFAMERKCIASSAMLAELASIHTVLARELLGTSKNPATQPSQAFLARLHALHDPKDALETPSRSFGATGMGSAQTPSITAGVELEDDQLDMQYSLNHDSLVQDDPALASKLVLQTVVLVIALAVVAWWILRESSFLQFPNS